MNDANITNVGELITFLKNFNPETEIVVSTDEGYKHNFIQGYVSFSRQQHDGKNALIVLCASL